jgi:hypothetical protein
MAQFFAPLDTPLGVVNYFIKKIDGLTLKSFERLERRHAAPFGEE